MRSPARQQFRPSSGTVLSFATAGAPSNPPILLLHGFPSSSRTFRDLIPALSKTAHVIAPDMPGFGDSDVLPSPSFGAFSQAISELLESLGIGPRYIYLHDFGAPVGFEIALRAPGDVLGLVIQNANAHTSGQGAGWAATQAFWSNPSSENEARATVHLTFEGIRDQYVANLPEDVAALISAENWEEDSRVMQLPGRMDTQRSLIADYGNYVAKFGAIADFLAAYQPPSLMVWGRHDPFFELKETQSWMEALPRMEAHILDGGHFLLETHAPIVAQLITKFLARHRRQASTND